MTGLLERTLHEPVAEKPRSIITSPEATSPAPPEGRPPVQSSADTPWPRGAKVLTAILLVVALLGAFGSIIAIANRDDVAATKRQYQSQIDQLTGQRDTAISAQRDLQTQLTAANDRATTVGAARDSLATVQSRIETLTGRTTELQAALDKTTVSNAVTQGQLAAQTDRTTWVTAERDALAKLFPLTFDASLVGLNLLGTYDIKWHEAYCSSLTTCGTTPSVQTATITASPEGWPVLTINGYVTAGLHRVDGALFTIVDTTTAVPAVGTTPRLARVAITLYAHGVNVADNGSRQITDLGASIAVSVPAVGDAPDGVAFYGAELTPQR
jgi:hypothetical protein